jgi:glutathione S-transferase
MYTLHIGNKNYSSWSLRPWILMKEQNIAFVETLTPFNMPDKPLSAFSPTAKVPVLVDGTERIWDSLAIAEYLAERHKGVWADDAKARAWSRSAAAEMHSGFGSLRDACSMNVGIRVKLSGISDGVRKDIDRIGQLWSEGLTRFGGPFLAGSRFTAVDAYYCPVAFRVQTYALELPKPAADYAKRLLALPGMKEWYEAGLKEKWLDQPHEDEVRRAGKITQDFRDLAKQPA